MSKIDDIYPLTIVKDRYSGTYSGALYTAWNLAHNEVPRAVSGSDNECIAFWDEDVKNLVGRGNTIEEAVADLAKKMEGKDDFRWDLAVAIDLARDRTRGEW